ncbi:hypothetical protein [Aquimarina mytili]|uniref:Conjugal transfer protein TraI n=1 Tax=Aquimarina mytili TaxID=874423 RepID=A0A937DBT5_9FLAO|nr:hypothetical protein [Aquimarina mytili]MBL0686067.1 hypothetical protein [Aquimarina mytili]
MKKQFIVMVLSALPFLAMGQIPVTDVAAGAQLSSLNMQVTMLSQSVTQTNSKLANLNSKVQNTNQKLEQANDYLKKLAELKEEEINTYKNAPDNRLVSYQKETLLMEKKRIVLQVKQLLQNLERFEYITENEKSKTEDRLSGMVTQVLLIWDQTTNLLNANDKIIPANERQKMLEETLDVFRKCISRMEQDQTWLAMVNKRRKSQKELFGF